MPTTMPMTPAGTHPKPMPRNKTVGQRGVDPGRGERDSTNDLCAGA